MPSRVAAPRSFVALALTAGALHAQEAPPARELQGEAPEARSWSFVDETTVPRRFEAIAQTRATYTHYSASPTRPFASNVAAPGTMGELGAEVGLGGGVSVAAMAVAGDAFAGAGSANAGGVAGLRYAPTLAVEGLRLALTGAYVRELTGANGVVGRASATYDLGAWRFGGTGVLEKVFAKGRDEADVMVVLGVQREVLPKLRVGVEYVGQDLEALVDEAEAEGGARHFVGGTIAYALLDDRLSLVGGPSLGLSGASPELLGRLGLAARF